jgi:nucleoside-diphosphate-sugar epimerase
MAALSRDWDGPMAVTIAGPSPLPYADFLQAVCRAAGLRPPRVVPLPLPPLLLAAGILRLIPGLPKVRAAELRRLTEDKAFDIGRMRHLLGVEPIPLETGLGLTFGRG